MYFCSWFFFIEQTDGDTFESNQRLGFNDDERDLSIGSRILKQLGIKKIKLNLVFIKNVSYLSKTVYLPANTFKT